MRSPRSHDNAESHRRPEAFRASGNNERGIDVFQTANTANTLQSAVGLMSALSCHWQCFWHKQLSLLHAPLVYFISTEHEIVESRVMGAGSCR